MYTLKQERKIYAYQGFRFGKAERFSPPEDLGNYWSDHLGDEAFNATHIGLKCPQGSGGDEDCLFLNVYTPFKPGTGDANNRTVMFFIHGGAFVAGDATSYLPTKLLNHDVILVTTHYRLGAFGFYTRNSPKAPGNLAFYDMISALRWVQNYISDFGGNPELVTIFGENLFRAVIAESGAALDHWAFDEDYTYATNYFEHEVGCDVYETEDEILDCMRKVPYLDLLEAGQKMIHEDRRNGLIGFRGCSPTIQTFNDSGLEFKNILYQHPRDFMINREFKDVPFLTGANREEGSLIVGRISDEPEGIAKSLQRIYCDGVDLGKFEESSILPH
ncbi:Carboxylesterase 3A [Armadillidium nasatum]|uniref:Carboxylesterase 3A n=1 Tax=Armadillidium nasatum TaxID=96803 RepID=A0A5N5T5Y0_9CRUS|nr:Carboxylesterase 3A [Armadillidium nasatum]